MHAPVVDGLHPGGEQPVELVEIGEPGGDAAHGVPAALDGLQLVPGALEQFGQDVVVVAGASLGDVVELLLGGVHRVGDVPLPLVGHL